MKAKHTPKMQAEIDRLRATVEAHEVVRDACFVALPECQVWGDVPGYIDELRRVNAEMRNALNNLVDVMQAAASRDATVDANWLDRRIAKARAALGKAQA